MKAVRLDPTVAFSLILELAGRPLFNAEGKPLIYILGDKMKILANRSFGGPYQNAETAPYPENYNPNSPEISQDDAPKSSTGGDGAGGGAQPSGQEGLTALENAVAIQALLPFIEDARVLVGEGFYADKNTSAAYSPKNGYSHLSSGAQIVSIKRQLTKDSHITPTPNDNKVYLLGRNAPDGRYLVEGGGRLWHRRGGE